MKGAEEGLRTVIDRNPGVYDERLRPLMGMGFLFSPDEEAELTGILEGIRARLPEEARKLPVLRREMDLTDLKALNTFGDWYSLGCSSAAVWGPLTADGTPSVVRNFDFFDLDLASLHQHLRVVAPPPGREGARGYAAVSYPGCIGAVTGLSDAGVFVAIHDVPVRPEMKDFVQRNVPRLCAIARLLAELPAAGAVEKAAGMCRGWNTLFGNNFIVATPEPAGGLPAGILEYDTREGTEKGVGLRGTDSGPSVVCSNHHRLRAKGLCDRYDALLAGIASRGDKPFDLPGLMALVERAAVPAAGRKLSDTGLATLHQAIALTGTKRLWLRFLVGDGNIRDAKWVEFDVTALVAATAARGAK